MKKDWKEVAAIIKAQMSKKEPSLKVKDVAEWLGLSSTSVAYFYLLRLEDYGFVKRVENGSKSEWFWNWKGDK